MHSIRTYFECSTRSQKKRIEKKRKTEKLTHFKSGNKKLKTQNVKCEKIETKKNIYIYIN